MRIEAAPGELSLTDNVPSTARSGKQGDLIVSELQGRFYEQAYRGRLFRTGSVAPVNLSANSITTATSATGTPIVGLWNPVGSGKNAVVLQSMLQAYANTLTAPVGPGSFFWLMSLNNSALTLGATPYNMLTQSASGSVCKGFIGGVALTGLTNAMAVAYPANFQNATGLTHGTITATNATLSSVGGVDNIDGSIIVPPGGVLGLYNSTSTTTFAAVGSLLWAEPPI